jgi:hypothetical protein
MSGINISSILPTDRNANLLRAINKYGMNLADFAALTTTSRFTGFGNGTGYTVSSWISDGVFANLAAVQSTYPIVQSGSDKVDWVLLQSAIDFIIFGAMDSAARGSMKRALFIPAGHYNINRTLHIGYGSAGTPPTGLNANRYVSIKIEGEGPQVDPQQGGMPGTTIITDNLTYPGIAISRPQQVFLKNFTIQGPYDAYLNVSSPLRDSDNWDRAAWRDTGIADANWLGGAAVNIGIGLDLYSNSTSAAAYPARVLPSYYGGGTTTASFGTVGGTDVSLEDVNIRGFVIGFGRPHGDNNGEFNRIKRGIIANCVHSVVMGHSQNRNVSIEDTNIGGFHTAITSVGGLTGNSNLHGLYSNIHFGQGFQLFDHPQGDWSGPLTLRDCYAESFFRIGTWLGRVKLDGCFLSFLEQEGSDGVPYSHFDVSRLVLDNTSIGGLRHGLFSKHGRNDGVKIEVTGGSSVAYGQNSAFSGHANLTEIEAGQRYMQGIFSRPGANNRVFLAGQEISESGYGNSLNFGDLRTQQTYVDQSYVDYFPQYPDPFAPDPEGSTDSNGAIHRFPVPKIIRDLQNFDVTSRSGFDLTCPRYTIINSGLEADVGDIFCTRPTGVDDTLEASTWFMVVSISGSNMVLRQMNNFNSTTSSDYSTNGFYQVSAGSGYESLYINTRIRQNTRLFVGDVTSGSAVISNVKHAFRDGSNDDFNSSNFQMAAGDYFLHHEIERANTAGNELKVHNLVSSIDFTANTITLTETFNITRTNYPLPFFIKVYNA